MRVTKIFIVLLLLIAKASCILDEMMQDNSTDTGTSKRSCPTKKKFKCDKDAKYRTIDGSCNNLKRPTLGMAGTPQARFIKAEYGEHDSPRQHDLLPGPRYITNLLFDPKDKSFFSQTQTVELMAFGQFLCHGVVATPGGKADLDCCDNSTNDEECYPISIPHDDAYFSTFNKSCMEFIRSAAADRDCFKDLRYREQINDVTSYIDGSMVYGSSNKQAAELRSFKGGKLKFKDGHLPENPKGTCKKVSSNDRCFLAGDFRVDEISNLVINHLLFVKLHNALAKRLGQINGHWEDEKIYQETRRIVGALVQHITYNEYLPNILGHYLMHKSGLSVYWGHRLINDYDKDVDPSVRNVYAAAGFRWGHTLIQNNLEFIGHDYQTYFNTTLSNHFFDNSLILQDNYPLKDFVRFLTHSNMMESDSFFQPTVRNHLFEIAPGLSFDLPARNIQRGRDHGIPSYNAWRQFCGLVVANFDDDVIVDHNKKNTRKLKKLYKNAWDIDLYAGAMTEIPEEGSLLGPTFACVWMKQYQALKFGDRFFYEWYRGDAGFTSEQLRSIKDITLSKLFCDMFHLDEIQKYVFRKPCSERNPIVKCSSLRRLNLNLWKEKHYYRRH